MIFCPKCGSILMPKKSGNKTIMACSCGYKEEAEKVTLKESVEQSKDIQVVEEGKHEHMPITDNKCKKCGNDKAYYFEKQTRSADESATRFYKCTKCGYTWREYK